MNRRDFTRTLGAGALAASLVPALQAQDRNLHKKFVVIGDGAVGKTSLLITYATGAFPGDYVPTVFDNYSATVNVHGRRLEVGLWDTAGQDDYDRLRPLSYLQTDLFLVCYDIGRRATLARVESKWVPEIKQHAPRVPFLLVGCKVDLRDQDRGEVSTGDGLRMAEKTNALGFHECSAKIQTGLKFVFDHGCRIALL